MSIAVRNQAVVSQPTIRIDRRPRFDGLLHKRLKTVRRRIRHATHPNPPETVTPYLLYRHGNQHLFIGLSATNSRFCATPVSLVDLDATRQAITPGANHCPPQFVKPRPSRLVASESKDFLQAKRAGTCLLAGHPPHGAKPEHQWHTRILKDRSGRYGSLATATPAFKQSRSDGPSSRMVALGTLESQGPTQLGQIIPASFLGCEPRFEFGKRSWKIIHAPVHYLLGLPESSG